MTKEFKEYCLSCKDHHKRGSLHYCGGIKTVFKYTSGKEVSSLEIVWSDVVADYPNSLLHLMKNSARCTWNIW